MSEGRRLNKAGIRCALAALAVFSGIVEIRSAKALEWEPVEGTQRHMSEPKPIQQDTQPGTPLTWTFVRSSDTTTKEQQGLNWTAVSETDPTEAGPVNNAIVWEPIQAGEVITAEELELKEDPDEVLVTTEPSGPTFANDKAIWRDAQWHPQISGKVPTGFGPKGFMISTSISGIDCVTGAGYCAKPESFDDYLDQTEAIGEAQYNLSMSLGDAEKLFGLTITSRFEETGLTFSERNANDTKGILSNYYIGAHISRALSPDTSIKFGVDNWLDIRECVDCGFAKSAYGVISQRIRFGNQQGNFFQNAYLTIGAGNGQFRPLEELIRDGIRKQRDAGCATPGFTPKKPCSPEALTRSSLRARSYGQINPIGAVALEAFPGMNLIGEWDGRNLNAGFSIRPFKDYGLVLTSMWNSLLPNCDYGCTIPVSGVENGINLKESLPSALTERARFSFQASLEFKF